MPPPDLIAQRTKPTAPLRMPLHAANQRILELISEADGPITLGLLPVTAQEEKEFVDLAITCCQGRIGKLIELLKSGAPAAAAYAVAASASQSVTHGRTFWEPLSEALKIDLSSNQDRERLSICFASTCRVLGVVDPDVSAMAWINIAPIMAQASILHRWADSLAHGLQTTIKRRPLPDLSDPRALQFFARDLATHIHNQPNLRRIIQTEVGSVVANRLIASCVYDQFDILPAHLVAPIKEALKGTGRQVSLKSPYASFSVVQGCFELVLPNQPAKLTTQRTHWILNGVQYSPVTEQRLSESQIGTGRLSVELRDLGEGYPDQSFDVSLGLTQPFRVFEQTSLRERPVTPAGETVLPPTDYLVVMKDDCSTNDPQSEEQRGQYRILQQVVMRPGWDPLTIHHDGTESTLLPALKAGIYRSSNKCLSTLLTDGKRLHYGDSFGFQAYIPKGQHCGTIQIGISSRDTDLTDHEVALHSEDLGGYDYSSALESALEVAVSGLSAGLHPLKIEIRTQAISIARELWYWRGLERISKHLGFLCTEPPQNIDWDNCTGLKNTSRGCQFIESYHAPKLVIALTGGEAIEITRPGVRAVALDPTDGWQSELTEGEILTVTEADTRVIAFESGGFESWLISCDRHELATLDERRTHLHMGLRSFTSQFGRSGVIEATSASGESIRLFGFATELVARRLDHDIDHGHGLHLWKTGIPTAELGRLALITHDYSDSPVPADLPPLELFGEQPESDEWSTQLRDGINLKMRHVPAEGNTPAILTLCMEVDPTKIIHQLLLIEWMHSGSETEHWQPLHCADGPNTSRLVSLLQGGGPIEEIGTNWWHHLWRVQRKKLEEDAVPLYRELNESEVETALDTISLLTSIKYPSSVYRAYGEYLSSLAHYLAKRRGEVGELDNDAWWRAGAAELQKHANEKVTPVVRQFLFSCNPQSMVRQWTSVPKPTGKDFGDIVSSLNLINVVRNAGGRVSYAQQVFHNSTHPQELFTSFENSNKVLCGQDSKYTRFDFKRFFEPILKRVADHNEAGTPLETPPLLSARHLLRSITALNRRVRVLAWASSREAEHPLTPHLQALASIRNQLETSIHYLNHKIGYQPVAWRANLERPDHFDANYFPDLPALGCDQSRQLADLTWAICLLNRATAHRLIGREDYLDRLKLFKAKTVQAHPINLMLSFAPELFAYYTALFDFSLLSPPTTVES